MLLTYIKNKYNPPPQCSFIQDLTLKIASVTYVQQHMNSSGSIFIMNTACFYQFFLSVFCCCSHRFAQFLKSNDCAKLPDCTWNVLCNWKLWVVPLCCISLRNGPGSCNASLQDSRAELVTSLFDGIGQLLFTRGHMRFVLPRKARCRRAVNCKRCFRRTFC